MGIGDTQQISKQISKLFFQITVHVNYLLDQTEDGRVVVFLKESWEEGGCMARLEIAVGSHNRPKMSLLF